MKNMTIPLCFIAILIFGSGCVTRTTSESSSNSAGSKYGSKKTQQVKEQKRIWIWQKEFRNTK